MKQRETEKIADLWKEEWKEITFDDKISEKEKFKISTYGRIINCNGENEFLKKPTYTNGYEHITVKQKVKGKYTARYVHKLVGEHFLEKKEGDTYVIHLNYDKKDNRIANLDWATKKEKENHQFTNPSYINGGRKSNAKLNEGRVRMIKKKIMDPNRRTRLRIIAKQFGISEMQLHRIKTGENWGWVKI